jgi:hypothetical protein
MVAGRPKISSWPDGSTSPGNYGFQWHLWCRAYRNAINPSAVQTPSIVTLWHDISDKVSTNPEVVTQSPNNLIHAFSEASVNFCWNMLNCNSAHGDIIIMTWVFLSEGKYENVSIQCKHPSRNQQLFSRNSVNNSWRLLVKVLCYTIDHNMSARA